jgi:hypothetical protein
VIHVEVNDEDFPTTLREGTSDVTLKAIIGPGDNLEPVITVMFPEED